LKRKRLHTFVINSPSDPATCSSTADNGVITGIEITGEPFTRK
jgi:hypothetical protein